VPTSGGSTAGLGGRVLSEFLRDTRTQFRANLSLRLLADLADQRSSTGLFVAYLKGHSLPRALAAVDPRGVERLGAGDRLGGAEVVFWTEDRADPGLWYLAHRREERPGRDRHGSGRSVDAEHYSVQTEIARNADIRGVTTVRLRGVEAGTRVLPMHLLPNLRLTRVEVAPGADATAATWTDVPFVQEKCGEDAAPAVVLGAGLVPDREILLRFSYEGRGVLADAGDGNFVVGARDSWYPNFGDDDPATFDLTYRVPGPNEVVSVGARREDQVEGGTRVSKWTTDQPIRVAGFNYGRFRERVRTDEKSGFEIRVFTNPGTPDVVKEINRILQAAASAPEDVGGVPLGAMDDSPIVAPPVYTGPSALTFDTSRLAEAALADGINCARLFNAFFGPLRTPRVSISQQSQWTFGQSWPTLIYLPYLSVLDSTQRLTLGLQGATSFVESVGFHEFAHQWWGHEVNGATYEDQWLSEGFAEFSAALALQYTKGLAASDRFWESARRHILAKPRGAAIANDEAGPLSLGLRLNSARNSDAYTAMVYSKGAYVLHMLQMTMRDVTAANPDQAFAAMMHDYLKTYAGRAATTRDFQTVVERHMVPALNATGDGKADWFFARGSAARRSRATSPTWSCGGRRRRTPSASPAACGRKASRRTSACSCRCTLSTTMEPWCGSVSFRSAGR
jgi:Peptidase family M1 domain